MNKTLDTGIKNSRNVLRYAFGTGTLQMLQDLLNDKRESNTSSVVFFIDEFFKHNDSVIERLPVSSSDIVIYTNTKNEPTTDYINELTNTIKSSKGNNPCAVVGMGGGITLDTAKAVANLLTNGGKAEDYQGWDLVKKPGIYKIGIPTLSGTGAEATRTCVMTNKNTGLKLGMNSDHTVYDQLILDPELTKTVPRNQYFYTGMDAYIHCMESLQGNYRNAIGDAFSHQTLALCREVFLSDDMMTDENRSKLMVASYLGGCAIANSYVGIVHPFSAGLSVVFNEHHCVANCMVMNAMEEFYPEYYDEFWMMVEKQGVKIPSGIAKGLNETLYDELYNSTVIHEKPLINALGENYKKILSRDKVREILEKI